MAIKANASSTGATGFKKYIGVGSFRVLGVNPTKAELEAFYGRDLEKEPKYFEEKKDNEGKPYMSLRVSYMIQADKVYEDDKPIKENAALKEPLKTTVSFFLDSRYRYNGDNSKVQVIDKYGRTAWVTIEQARNHQIPVYKNGPAKLDADYRPCYNGEEALTQFILNYLNVTPIDSFNKNTGEWMTNPHPEDCEGRLEQIQSYFKGNISELKEHCTMMPFNRVKLLLGVQTDDQGKQQNNVYNRLSLRNGSRSYTRLKDAIDGDNKYLQEHGKEVDTVYSDDPAGIITDIHEYNDNVQETNLAAPADPFSQTASPADDLPFGPASSEDPFAGLSAAS